MRVLFALPGFHRFDRGAEIALIAVASELARGGDSVTLIGSGTDRPPSPYRFVHAPSLSRERFEAFPSIPMFRNETAYEDATFVPGLLRHYRPSDYDITVTCSFPFTSWALRRPTLRGRERPPHVFVTQNGDWPAYANNSEYRWFGCEGLVCTNPDYFARNKDRWRCSLIPNGIDLQRFTAGQAERESFGLPPNGLVVLMVSALIPTKRVSEGIDAVSRVEGAHLVVAGDGPLRAEVAELASRLLLPGHFTRLSVTPDKMPALYRSADVFLHMSKEESFGNVFLEAMACGLPIVAHDSPRLRWIVGDDEFLLDSTDISTVGAFIATAAGARTRQASRRGRTEAFAWPRIASMYRSFFEKVISSGSNV